MLLGRVEGADGSSVHVARDERDADAAVDGETLELLDEPVAFLLMLAGTPVVVEIVEQLDLRVELVREASDASRLRKEGNNPALHRPLRKGHSGIGNRDP